MLRLVKLKIHEVDYNNIYEPVSSLSILNDLWSMIKYIYAFIEMKIHSTYVEARINENMVEMLEMAKEEGFDEQHLKTLKKISDQIKDDSQNFMRNKTVFKTKKTLTLNLTFNPTLSQHPILILNLTSTLKFLILTILTQDLILNLTLHLTPTLNLTPKLTLSRSLIRTLTLKLLILHLTPTLNLTTTLTPTQYLILP